MTRIVIGIDPDADAHAAALYVDGVLAELQMLRSYPLALMAKEKGAICSIEHVSSNRFVYGRNTNKSKTVQSNIAMKVGRNQQAQIELCRLLDELDVSYQLVKPQRGNWAKDKAMFERITGWTGRSNVDTRSASYFGYLLAV